MDDKKFDKTVFVVTNAYGTNVMTSMSSSINPDFYITNNLGVLHLSESFVDVVSWQSSSVTP